MSAPLLPNGLKRTGLIQAVNDVGHVVDSNDRPRYLTAFKIIKDKPLKVSYIYLAQEKSTMILIT
jgi:hypothetical protein